METTFTPWASLAGGILIGISAVLLMAANGKVAGISGITSRLFVRAYNSDIPAGAAFVAGLVFAPVVYILVSGQSIPHTVPFGPAVMAMAGLLVGFGTVIGNGCTSGHGVCGMARLSVRSAAATAVFMVFAVVTVFVIRHVIGA